MLVLFIVLTVALFFDLTAYKTLDFFVEKEYTLS